MSNKLFTLDGTPEVQTVLGFFRQIDTLVLKLIEIGVTDARTMNMMIFTNILRFQQLEPETCRRLLEQECIQTKEAEATKRTFVAMMIKKAKED